MKLKFPLLIVILFWLISGVQLQAQDLTSTVTALDWNSSGDLIAVALGKPANEFCYNNPDYYVINLLNSDGSLSKELRRHACAITGLAFSPDDSQLVSVDLSGLIVLWDVSSGEQLINTEARFPWKKVAWSSSYKHYPNNRRLCSVFKRSSI